MDVIELLPRLHLLRFPVGQAYLWRDGEELTLVDAGPVGSGAVIAEAVRALGRAPEDVRRIVLTHFHEDHVGGAGEFAALSGAQVLAHRLDAPFVRGELPGPAPRLEEWERPIRADVAGRLPEGTPMPPPSVLEVTEGEVLEFGGGARVVHAPGHTDGSIALHLPAEGVLFTGDTVASLPAEGVLSAGEPVTADSVNPTVIPGVFNLDRAQLLDSVRRLADLGAEVACFGHGDPVLRGAAAALRGATAAP
ncbi:MBL fold metallo-hydrolase [Streptomyces misionensis]|uniref:MBL fold metallo-hydrolase n=1 Tax=Streptomyces misionensis TaxID=67331 RepID=A0A5C6JY13_9ACTN|nr:MBL fold metallo-hydrolase [Streptomyces misionensis]TWV49283.1 MBL fold metallo-hydrolase [Streptomyces misionensis]